MSRNDVRSTASSDASRPLKIAYVIYNERPDSGLIVGQVVSLLRQIKRTSVSIHMTLIAIWQPWVARKYRQQIRDLAELLARDGVLMVNHATAIIPSRYFMYQPLLFPILRTWATISLRRALAPGFDVVHCRSYLASYIAARLKRAGRPKVIFDMRSLWPKEHVTIGVWSEQDAAYQMWADIERFTLRTADASVAVSQPMVDIVKADVPDARAHLIPICVDVSKFRFDFEARARRREELGWGGDPIIAYQGSLGLMNSNLVEVVEYFALVRRVEPRARFLILTSNHTVDIGAVMARFGIAAEHYAIHHPRQSELVEWLSAADAGIHAMSPGPDSATRLGVKVVEYLSCGLPLLLNRHVGAAADIARRHGVGIVIDVADEADAARQMSSLFANGAMREHCANTARELFSIESCARSYVELYGALAGPTHAAE